MAAIQTAGGFPQQGVGFLQSQSPNCTPAPRSTPPPPSLSLSLTPPSNSAVSVFDCIGGNQKPGLATLDQAFHAREMSTRNPN